MNCWTPTTNPSTSSVGHSDPADLNAIAVSSNFCKKRDDSPYEIRGQKLELLCSVTTFSPGSYRNSLRPVVQLLSFAIIFLYPYLTCWCSFQRRNYFAAAVSEFISMQRKRICNPYPTASLPTSEQFAFGFLLHLLTVSGRKETAKSSLRSLWWLFGICCDPS